MTERREAVTRKFAIVAVVALCLAALGCIGMVLGMAEGRFIGTAVALAGYSLAGFVASTRLGRKPAWLGPVGLTVAVVGLLLMLTLIWIEPDADLLDRAAVIAVILSAALTHASLLLPRRYDDDGPGALVVGSVAAIAVLAATLIVPIAFDADLGGSYLQLLTVVAILVVLGTLVVPVSRRLAGGGDDGGHAAEAYAPAPRPAPASTSETVLGLTYLGRTFEIRATRSGSAGEGFAAEVWEIEPERAVPMPTQGRLGVREDLPSAFASTAGWLIHALVRGEPSGRPVPAGAPPPPARPVATDPA